MNGEEIQRALVLFARRWSLYDGSERAEAQTFVNELFACYGTDRHEAGARFEEAQAGQFLDLLWPRRCLIEMKRPSEAGRLVAHREQALGYWRRAADPAHNVPAPRFVVLSLFTAFAALRDRHRELDLAVVDGYGWEPEVLGDLRERNRRLYALNGEIVAGARHYVPL